MKLIKPFVSMLVILAITSSSVALARPFYHGPRFGLGIYVNPFPVFASSYYYGGPYYYPNTYRYYPDVVVAPPTTVYIEQSNSNNPPNNYVTPGTPQQSSGDWYYCHNPDGFYPSIKSCPAGWQRVPAQAPADR
ncbi:hypothetical protein QN372_11160 [Undibacterium sp. RTI2.1]|uniref:hypothetical protein n=1 Tax=unclassified Undibacterium TaxID=2630295 RepID=UPI002AB53379|nr:MULTISPECIES: hypothetical protein [unclassified Undibacterium]MDY7537181.1 hypothetical protein [Undibacterium sp. 5I1]MEB0031308.1 hypothetical protein [Undibacterium sp. RTI2.1]MEB0117677.1 hypothetical protein [Undibacterium sp. RTI2.2]MEB0233098.1 hypothetical protein [Undibacterium sp. 10I3]MEB0259843.1 hypothetical protein [Undibacterium sp. 5I1]